MLMQLKAPAVKILLFAVVAFCLEGSGYAQLSTASVTGIVRDVTGAVIPQARVVLRNVGTSVELTTTSNSAGNYLFLNVNPGPYTLETSVAGFKSARISELTLAVNQTATIDLVLEVGTLDQSVSVEASTSEVESATAELGSVVAEKQVVDLPLNGRNFTQLLSLSAGVAPVSVSQNASGPFGVAITEGSQFVFPAINRQTNRSNFFMLDGIDNNGMVSTY